MKPGISVSILTLIFLGYSYIAYKRFIRKSKKDKKKKEKPLDEEG